MSSTKDYNTNQLPKPQLLRKKDDNNNVVREVRVYPYAGQFNNSLWYLFELCLMPLIRCVATLGMTWTDIFTEVLNVMSKHPLSIMTQLVSGKYSTKPKNQVTFVQLVRDFVTELILTPNPRDSLYHYLEVNLKYSPRDSPTSHWSNILFLRKCGIYMNGYARIPSMETTALWYFGSFPPGWQASYVMHNPSEVGIPDAKKISLHMTLAQQTNVPYLDGDNNLRRISNYRPETLLLEDQQEDRTEDHHSWLTTQPARHHSNKKRCPSNAYYPYERSHPRRWSEPRQKSQEHGSRYVEKSRYNPRRNHRYHDQQQRRSHDNKPKRYYSDYKSNSSNKTVHKADERSTDYKKSNNKNDHDKPTKQLEQHQIDQGSVASMSVTSVHSPDSHEHSHSSSTTDLDNLQLDADKLDDFNLVELEEVSESLEQECLALEAQGLNLNAESLFAEDRKPAACPEPGEVTSNAKQETNDAASQTDNVGTPKSN